MRRISYKKIFSAFAWIMVVATVLLSLAFAAKNERNTVVGSFDIAIEGNDENFFLSEAEVREFLSQGEAGVVAKKYREISLPALEKKLNSHPAVANAEIAADINGMIHVAIRQREPVLRLINKNGESYYIDSDTRLMPLNDNYSARVLVATGEIAEPYARRYQYTVSQIRKSKLFSSVSLLDDLCDVATMINADSVLSPLIHQINVNGEGELELYPVMGNHRIVLGEASGAAEKLNKLRLFYAQGLSKSDSWTRYGTINLKYKNLVVCTKK